MKITVQQMCEMGLNKAEFLKEWGIDKDDLDLSSPDDVFEIPSYTSSQEK